MFDAYILSNVVQQRLRTRAVVADMKGQLTIHQTIGLSALKQLTWDNHDDCDEEVDGPKSYYCRWVDTSVTSTDIFDTRPTEKSLAIKEVKRKWEH